MTPLAACPAIPTPIADPIPAQRKAIAAPKIAKVKPKSIVLTS
jgi:hypothetical protein